MSRSVGFSSAPLITIRAIYSLPGMQVAEAGKSIHICEGTATDLNQSYPWVRPQALGDQVVEAHAVPGGVFAHVHAQGRR